MNVQPLSVLLQKLSDTNRLQIIRYLDNGACSVSEIVNQTGLSQPLVSHHLRVLRENYIVEAERRGANVFYRVADSRLLDVLGVIEELAGMMPRNRFDNNQISDQSI